MNAQFIKAKDHVRKVYKTLGFELSTDILGSAVDLEFNKSIKESELAPLFVFLDEQIALLRQISFYFISSVSEDQPHAAVFYQLTIRQLKIAVSIRLQCTYGLDAEARLQLRLLYENSLIWCRIIVDKEAREEFPTAHSPEEANRYWHKYLSRSKSEKFLDNYFKAEGHMWMGNYKQILDDLKTKTGPAAHPSFIAAHFTTVEDWHNGENFTALGNPALSSRATLSLTIYATSIPFVMSPSADYNLQGSDLTGDGLQLCPLTLPDSSWDEFNQKIMGALVTLWLGSTPFSNELNAMPPLEKD